MSSWATGRCHCGAVTVELSSAPLITHACYCEDCQRVTGSVVAVNLWIEEDRVTHAGETTTRTLTTGSGKGKEVRACAACACDVSTRYLASPAGTIFVRGGVLDDAARTTPDVHIFTRSKAPWIVLPEGARAFDAFYDLKATWAPESVLRLKAVRERVAAK